MFSVHLLYDMIGAEMSIQSKYIRRYCQWLCWHSTRRWIQTTGSCRHNRSNLCCHWCQP